MPVSNCSKLFFKQSYGLRCVEVDALECAVCAINVKNVQNLIIKKLANKKTFVNVIGL